MKVDGQLQPSQKLAIPLSLRRGKFLKPEFARNCLTVSSTLSISLISISHLHLSPLLCNTDTLSLSLSSRFLSYVFAVTFLVLNLESNFFIPCGS